METWLVGLYIPMTNDASSEGFDLNTYLSQFSVNVWIAILTQILSVAIVKSILLYRYKSTLNIQGFVGFIWTSFIAFFGGPPKPTAIDKKFLYKIVVFTSLLSGSIFWMSYRGTLQAELSVSQKKYPFKDIIGLSKTNWRYVLTVYLLNQQFEFQFINRIILF